MRLYKYSEQMCRKFRLSEFRDIESMPISPTMLRWLNDMVDTGCAFNTPEGKNMAYNILDYLESRIQKSFQNSMSISDAMLRQSILSSIKAVRETMSSGIYSPDLPFDQ